MCVKQNRRQPLSHQARLPGLRPRAAKPAGLHEFSGRGERHHRSHWRRERGQEVRQQRPRDYRRVRQSLRIRHPDVSEVRSGLQLGFVFRAVVPICFCSVAFDQYIMVSVFSVCRRFISVIASYEQYNGAIGQGHYMCF